MRVNEDWKQLTAKRLFELIVIQGVRTTKAIPMLTYNGKPMTQKMGFALMRSPAYKQMKAQLERRLRIRWETESEEMLNQMRRIAGKSLHRFEEVVEESENLGAVTRIGNSMLDRIGLERQSSSEVRHLVILDADSVERLTQAERALAGRQANVVELKEEDWAYASERPAVGFEHGPGDVLRGGPASVSAGRPPVNPLHGNRGDGVAPLELTGTRPDEPVGGSGVDEESYLSP